MSPPDEPRIYEDPPPPGREGRGVRLVCGALLGVALGLLVWMRARFDVIPGLILMALSVVGCAFGSARWGDAFWNAILRRGA